VRFYYDYSSLPGAMNAEVDCDLAPSGPVPDEPGFENETIKPGSTGDKAGLLRTRKDSINHCPKVLHRNDKRFF
jgi:hypothetical protein